MYAIFIKWLIFCSQDAAHSEEEAIKLEQLHVHEVKSNFVNNMFVLE